MTNRMWKWKPWEFQPTSNVWYLSEGRREKVTHSSRPSSKSSCQVGGAKSCHSLNASCTCVSNDFLLFTSQARTHAHMWDGASKLWPFILLFKIFIYLFILAAVGLHYYVWGYSLVVVRGLLIAVVFPVLEHRLYSAQVSAVEARGLSNWAPGP